LAIIGLQKGSPDRYYWGKIVVKGIEGTRAQGLVKLHVKGKRPPGGSSGSRGMRGNEEVRGFL